MWPDGGASLPRSRGATPGGRHSSAWVRRDRPRGMLSETELTAYIEQHRSEGPSSFSRDFWRTQAEAAQQQRRQVQTTERAEARELGSCAKGWPRSSRWCSARMRVLIKAVGRELGRTPGTRRSDPGDRRARAYADPLTADRPARTPDHALLPACGAREDSTGQATWRRTTVPAGWRRSIAPGLAGRWRWAGSWRSRVTRPPEGDRQGRGAQAAEGAAMSDPWISLRDFYAELGRRQDRCRARC